MQPGVTGHPPYGMGAGRQPGPLGCFPTDHTRTPLGAARAWSHAMGCLHWLGAGALSPTPVRLCRGVWGSAPQRLGATGPRAQPQWVPWGGLAHPGVPWGFQPLGCSNHSLKPNYICSQAGAVSLRGAMPQVGSTPVPLGGGGGGAPHSGFPPPRGTHLVGGTGEGAPTIPVPATGGHLHTGAGVATLGTVPRGPAHRRSQMAAGAKPWPSPLPPYLGGWGHGGEVASRWVRPFPPSSAVAKYSPGGCADGSASHVGSASQVGSRHLPGCGARVAVGREMVWGAPRFWARSDGAPGIPLPRVWVTAPRDHGMMSAWDHGAHRIMMLLG